MSDVDFDFEEPREVPEPDEYEAEGREEPSFEADPVDHAEQREVVDLDDDREA